MRQTVRHGCTDTDEAHASELLSSSAHPPLILAGKSAAPKCWRGVSGLSCSSDFCCSPSSAAQNSVSHRPSFSGSDLILFLLVSTDVALTAALRSAWVSCWER